MIIAKSLPLPGQKISSFLLIRIDTVEESASGGRHGEQNYDCW